MMNVQYGTPGTNDIDMGQAALGTYDATWLSWLKSDAAQAAANGTPVTVVRIWQEINGDWEPWSINQTGATSVDGTAPGSPWSAATIIAAWNHMAAQVHTAFPNAKIEWNLSAGGPWSGPSGAGNGSGFDLYPGDQYVNVIGLDAYEKSTSWANTVSGPGVNLNNLVAFASAHGKEVAVSETATTNNDGSYLTSMTNYFDALGKEAAYISYYDQGTANNGGDIIYSSSGPDSAPADRVALNESSFGTKPYIGSL
jgi:beta-mannanase